MSYRKPRIIAALALLPATAFGARVELPFEQELDSCVSAIYQNIDLQGAVKVRHIVSNSERSPRGYELRIDTIVYRSDSSEQFSAVCLARGSLEPFRLSINRRVI